MGEAGKGGKVIDLVNRGLFLEEASSQEVSNSVLQLLLKMTQSSILYLQKQ